MKSKCTLHFKHPVFSLPEFQTVTHWKETGVDGLPSTFRNKALKKEKEDVQRRLQKHMDESEIERSESTGGEDVLEC